MEPIAESAAPLPPGEHMPHRGTAARGDGPESPRAGQVAIVFGTRPEIIKLAGVIRRFGRRARTIFSGQHFDRQLSGVMFDDLHLARPDVVLDVGGRSRAQQIGALVQALEAHLTAHRPAVLVVQGDTNTALGGALAANALEIPLVHVEAGLRSFDRRMPEEHNRVVIDHLADLCLAPTDCARDNLLAEGIPGSRIAVTGNTVVDAALELLPSPEERAALVARFGLTAGRFVLATFHRPENVDDHERLEALIDQLSRLSLPVVFPVHPRTRARMDAHAVDGRASLRITPPLDYPTFLGLAAECAFLVSDSGGVQEEASVLKRPALVVRRSTERPEVLGTFATLVDRLADVAPIAATLSERLEDTHARLAVLPGPYGDGRASHRCADLIDALVSAAERSSPMRSAAARE